VSDFVKTYFIDEYIKNMRDVEHEMTVRLETEHEIKLNTALLEEKHNLEVTHETRGWLNKISSFPRILHFISYFKI